MGRRYREGGGYLSWEALWVLSVEDVCLGPFEQFPIASETLHLESLLFDEELSFGGVVKPFGSLSEFAEKRIELACALINHG